MAALSAEGERDKEHFGRPSLNLPQNHSQTRPSRPSLPPLIVTDLVRPARSARRPPPPNQVQTQGQVQVQARHRMELGDSAPGHVYAHGNPGGSTYNIDDDSPVGNSRSNKGREENDITAILSHNSKSGSRNQAQQPHRGNRNLGDENDEADEGDASGPTRRSHQQSYREHDTHNQNGHNAASGRVGYDHQGEHFVKF